MTESAVYVDDKTRRRLGVQLMAGEWMPIWFIPGTDAQPPEGEAFILIDEMPAGTPAKKVAAELERRCYVEAQRRGLVVPGLKPPPPVQADVQSAASPAVPAPSSNG